MSVFLLCLQRKNTLSEPIPLPVETQKETKPPLEAISVNELMATRLSNREIQIEWSDAMDSFVEKYIIKALPVLASEKSTDWEILEIIESDNSIDGNANSIIHTLEDSSPQQYKYEIDIVVRDPQKYKAEKSISILASNIMVCIDPGHFAGKNMVSEDISYNYAEGDFTLQLALELKQILKKEYGIDSYMTRETESITINGYTDSALDSGHISLRGEYAALNKSDLFISLHTNANEDNANGYATRMQPLAINKPIIILNTVACSSKQAVNTANAIGMNLAVASYQLGIATTNQFLAIAPHEIKQWTATENDKLHTPGSVYCRLGNNGDYYGVLRGASNVNIPGMIIEHGFHTVPQMRKEAIEGNLKTIWAKADAYGIAYGLGFVTEISQSNNQIQN